MYADTDMYADKRNRTDTDEDRDTDAETRKHVDKSTGTDKEKS